MRQEEKDLRSMLSLETPAKEEKSYSIVAGAGAGKTTLLSFRISRQIAQGIPIDQFVIITYTNAAATELREKIASQLEQLLNTYTDEEIRKNIEIAIGSIELMQISTIHSFLLKLLREAAFEAKVTLDAKLLDEEDDQERKEAFFETWYRKHFHEIQSYRNQWCIKSKSGKVTDYTRQVFHNMFMSLANVREEVILYDEDHEQYYEQWAKDYCAFWYPRLRKHSEAILEDPPLKKDGTSKGLNKAAQDIISTIAQVQDAMDQNEYGLDEAKALGLALETALSKKLVIEKKYYKGYEEEIPCIERSVKELQEEADKDPFFNFNKIASTYFDNSQKATEVAKYVLEMQKAYQKEIDTKTAELSNDDILYRAEQLLRQYPEIRDQLRARYQKIYVDEFQDTTLMQTNIVKMLVSTIGSEPEEEQLSDGKLIVVGDPKQSIYRFSGAERSVYDAVNEWMTLLPKADVVELNTNFRSNKTIIDWVNNSYAKILGDDYKAMETDWQIKDPRALHGVFQYRSDAEKYNTEADIEAVVNLVKAIVNQDNVFLEIPNWKEKKEELRKIQYSDIMIITKNTTKMSLYVDAFAKEGIPVNVAGKFVIGGNEVLKNYVILASYLANPKDEKKYFAAMQVLGGIDMLEANEKTIVEVAKQLEALRENMNMDAPSILQYLLLHEELYVSKAKEYTKEDIRAYRIHLHQMVETCIQENNGDLADYVDAMNEYMQKDVAREVLLESDENAIRLMNVHKSKGLTAQVVIIADRRSSEACKYDGFKKAGKYYPAVTYQASPEASPTILPTYTCNRELWQMAHKDEASENQRLEYVAATRGAHALIIMPVASSRMTPWFTNSAYHYEELPEINEWLKEHQDQSITTKEKKQNEEKREVLTIQNLLNAKAQENPSLALPQVISVTPSALEPLMQTGYTPEEEGYVSEKRPRANIFGTVMHRVFELLFLQGKEINKDNKEVYIQGLIKQAIFEQKENLRPQDKPEEFQQYLETVIPHYFDTFVKEVMEEAEAIYPEYAFSFYIKNEEMEAFKKQFASYFEKAAIPIPSEAQSYWVNGNIDLVVKNKDGSIHIYDYKSDLRNGKPLATFEESLQNKYAGQLALYKYAVVHTFDIDPKQVDTTLIHLYR